jgi:hypothetical protein
MQLTLQAIVDGLEFYHPKYLPFPSHCLCHHLTLTLSYSYVESVHLHQS